MKKVFKVLLAFAVLLAGASMMVACGDDEEDDPQPVVVHDPINALFAGTTKTTCTFNIPGSVLDETTFSTTDTKWNVIIETARRRATIKMLNVRFNDKMPQLPLMVLDNLTFDPDTNTVSGENIIPKVEEGGGLTPYDSFPFESITARFDDQNRRYAYITFVVAGPTFTGKGEFGGSYTLQP